MGAPVAQVQRHPNELAQLSRRELQQRCKQLGIRANQSNAALIEQLRAGEEATAASCGARRARSVRSAQPRSGGDGGSDRGRGRCASPAPVRRKRPRSADQDAGQGGCSLSRNQGRKRVCATQHAALPSAPPPSAPPPSAPPPSAQPPGDCAAQPDAEQVDVFALDRRGLQQLCKQLGLRANQKTQDLRLAVAQRLREEQNTEVHAPGVSFASVAKMDVVAEADGEDLSDGELSLCTPVRASRASLPLRAAAPKSGRRASRLTALAAE